MSRLTGTATLLRLALRRDRVMLPVWLYASVGSLAATAVSFRRLYPTPASQQEFAATVNATDSLRAVYGSVHSGSIGGLTAWRMGTLGGVVVALMSFLLVIRHSRAEEEAGRLELLGAGATGRTAPPAAAVSTALLGNTLVGLLMPLVLISLGEPAAGSFAFGLAVACCGLVFTGTAAVAAQVFETGRAANGTCGALLGLAFLLRAADPSLSPLGWIEEVHAYGGDRWWTLAPPLAAATAQLALASALVARRDLGAGLLPQRPGPARAADRLRSPAALAWRLQRGTLLGWSLGFLTAGTVFGGLAGGVRSLVGGSTQMLQVMQRLGGRPGVTDSYLATMAGLLGMAAAVYAVQAVLRLRSEEAEGRAEPLLATPVSRLRWAAGHLLHPSLGSLALLLAGGLGLSAGAALSGVPRTAHLLGGTLAQAPAAWLAAAVALALIGLAPTRTPLAWGLLGAALLISFVGPALNAGQWLLDLSPFTHVPAFSVRAEPLLWLTALTAALTLTGLTALQRRDLT
ncbi:ABC transporter permease [Streptacidiphilus sp. N1-12]|uniref:ABC transporter permease n=2 Tax=Streptacidiphilus alkalitolerans TaxID=3342712 RepID=A0ABV6W765_9ACTN